jgi:hypothetical protein
VCWGRHGWQSDVQSEGTWRRWRSEARPRQTGLVVDAANGLHCGPLCCTPLQLLQEKMGPRAVRSALCGAAGRGGWGFMMCFIRRLKRAASAAVAVSCVLCPV